MLSELLSFLVCLCICPEPTPYVIVDRIEGQYAVVEAGDEFADLPLVVMPTDVAEGDLLQIVHVAPAVQRRREAFVEALQRRMAGE